MRVKFIFVFDKVVGHGKNATPLSKNCLEKAEDSFDDHPVRFWLWRYFRSKSRLWETLSLLLVY